MTTSPRRLRFDSLQQEAFLNLWRTYDRLRQEEDALFEQYQLTAQQYNALRLLKARHPEPVATLALQSRLVSRAPDITRMIDRLEERGWIARQRPPENRRLVLLTLTPAGLALLESLAEPVRACSERQLGHLSAKQLKDLVRLLELARDPHEESSGPWKPQGE